MEYVQESVQPSGPTRALRLRLGIPTDGPPKQAPTPHHTEARVRERPGAKQDGCVNCGFGVRQNPAARHGSKFSFLAHQRAGTHPNTTVAERAVLVALSWCRIAQKWFENMNNHMETIENGYTRTR